MVHERVTFPSVGDAAKTVQPRVGSLDHVPASVAAHFSAVVSGRLGAIPAVRTEQLDSLLSQAITKRIAVVAAVSNQRYLLGQRYGNVVDSLFDQVGFGAIG